jgi:peptidoglycan/xylan/chitin deacetylase (PgdA/CDA1 family)
MSIEALQRLAASRFVTIGAHSHDHQLLTRIGADAARASIARSRDLLRRWTGQAVDHFAYPSGAYDDEVMRLVQDLGFRSAVTTEGGLWTVRAPLHAIPRIAVGRYDSAAVFGINLLGGLRRLMRFAGS